MKFFTKGFCELYVCLQNEITCWDDTILLLYVNVDIPVICERLQPGVALLLQIESYT